MLHERELGERAIATVAPLESILREIGDGNKLITAIHNKKILVPLTQQLEHCALLDHENEAVSVSLGEFCSRILALPLPAQRTITTLLAHQMGIQPPTYEHAGRGRPTTGRDQLASVIYHAYPDDLRKDGKDSKAGKRITDHVRRYQLRVGARARRDGSTAGRAPSVGRYRHQFQQLYKIAKPEEGLVLARLFEKLGVPINTLNKWSEGRLLENAINITPEPSTRKTPTKLD